MPSPQPAPAAFSSPWRLFTWTLAGSPAAVLALAAMLLGVLGCEVAIPWLLAQVIDGALIARSIAQVDLAGIVLIGVTAVLYFVHVGYLRAETVLLYRAMLRLRSLLYSRILEQPLDFFAHAKAGELSHLVLNDTEVLESHGVYVFSDVPFSVLTTLAILVLMFAMDWRMALVVVAFLAVATILSFRLGRPLPTLRKTIQKTASQLAARITETVGGIRTVKAFGRTAHEKQSLDAITTEVSVLEMKEGRLGAWVEPMLELMEMLGIGLIVWYGAHRVIAGAMTPGLLVAFIAYMELLSEPVSRAGRYVRHVQSCRGVMQRLVQFLDGLMPAPRSGNRIPHDVRVVSFADVTYRYPGTERPALADVRFSATPGERIVIVGRNGAGKSTLIELLLGLRQPERGTVQVAGCPVSEWQAEAWHETIALMPQEVFLFHMSLADNIRYGRLDATRGEIENAAEIAGLGALIRRLSAGLDTVVGDRGQRLSGGERQRVALARMILRDPSIVVLDEPTSALDGEAARDVASLLRSLASSRTVFVVAHRPDAIELATRVFILDAGRIVFDGPPEQARLQPVFQRLFGEPEPAVAGRKAKLTPVAAA